VTAQALIATHYRFSPVGGAVITTIPAAAYTAD
jgi:hypothetical protein